MLVSSSSIKKYTLTKSSLFPHYTPNERVRATPAALFNAGEGLLIERAALIRLPIHLPRLLLL